MKLQLDHLEQFGFSVVPAALSAAEVSGLVAAVEGLAPAGEAESRGGRRDLFSRLPAVQRLAGHFAIHRWPAAVLGDASFAVRAILFDKTADANWKVAWHQDLTIPIRERRAAPGFGPWSDKAGIPHVQPPHAVLARMLTVRIHLDQCDRDNGPVRVFPGSHRFGRLSADQIDEWKGRSAPVDTTCPVGGLLLMRPLLLHASSPALRPGHRRVIHLEYAADELPAGLEWRERWRERSSASAEDR